MRTVFRLTKHHRKELSQKLRIKLLANILCDRLLVLRSLTIMDSFMNKNFLSNSKNALLLILLLGILIISVYAGYRAFLFYKFPTSAENLLIPFKSNSSTPVFNDYKSLFEYFLVGFTSYKSPYGARAYYPGDPMIQGPKMASLEGFARTAPLFASWIHGQHGTVYTLKNGVAVDLVQLLKTGIVNGTDPQNREYWGKIYSQQQSIVEAADIALVLWLTKPQLWDNLSANQKQNISRWLYQVNGKEIPDSNWHLFVIQVNAILFSLGEPYDAKVISQSYQRIKSFYVGDGWFKDGESEDRSTFDYYNGWAFHYHLQWINKILPSLDPTFIRLSLNSFLNNYKFLMGSNGLPIMGRSACYRMAAPAPLIFGQDSDNQAISSGLAKRALDKTWQFFIQQGALKYGNVTQGYCGKDSKILEKYSGPASCLWSLRSLTVAFSQPISSSFWQAEIDQLPIEENDYNFEIPAIGWQVVGDKKSANISILIKANASNKVNDSTMNEIGLYDETMQTLTSKSRRPNNYEIKYQRGEYSSSQPFCGCKE